jgi:hypothetical protein
MLFYSIILLSCTNFASFYIQVWNIISYFEESVWRQSAQGNMRAVCKVHELTLLLQVRTLWRCGDSLFFEVPPLASNALLTTLHPLLENVLQTVDHFKIFCLGAPFSWLEKPRNCMEWDLNWILCSAWRKWIGGTPLEHPPYSPDLAPCDFWTFLTMKWELWGKKFRSYQWSTARFWEVGGALWQVHCLPREVLQKETVTAPPWSSDSE